MLLLLLVIVAAFTAVMAPETVNYFLFNNRESELATTELVDEELNINLDIKISVLEVEGADGYEVSYSTDKDFDKKTIVIVEVETADKAVESLTAGRTYYVRVKAFKYNEDEQRCMASIWMCRRLRHSQKIKKILKCDIIGTSGMIL